MGKTIEFNKRKKNKENTDNEKVMYQIITHTGIEFYIENLEFVSYLLKEHGSFKSFKKFPLIENMINYKGSDSNVSMV
jgi:hypothetical protein